MADITNLFKATVKTMKSRLKVKAQLKGNPPKSTNDEKPDQSILQSKSKRRGDFEKKAKDVVSSISKLRDFLLQYRKDYLGNAKHLTHGQSRMSDAERDQIDADAEMFMRTCSEAIKQLRELENGQLQTKEHRGSVLQLMEGYLNGVCKVYSGQRAVRVKRAVDKKRIGRLEPEKRRQESFVSHVARTEGDPDKEGMNIAEPNHAKKSKTELSSLDGDNEAAVREVDDELSPEEIQMFEQENKQLYQEMNSMRDEVKHIEGKVVEISKLQEIFADKVLDQEVKVDRISDTVSGTTDNIKEANEEIREAMKSNAGLRVWILFFLIVCTFSLLFLDWYNP